MYGRLMVVSWELVSVLGGGKKKHIRSTRWKMRVRAPARPLLCVPVTKMMQNYNRAQQKNKSTLFQTRITLTCEPHCHLFFWSSAMLTPDQALIQVERCPSYAS